MSQRLFNREVSVVFTNRADISDVIRIEDPKITGKEPVKIDFQVEKQLALGTLNRADLTIINLSDDTASKINFRKPVTDIVKLQKQRFGRMVEIFAGYEGQSRRIFKGLITSAITSKKGAVKLTDIECMNDFYETMNTHITESFSAGTTKSAAILKILKIIDSPVSVNAEKQLKSRLTGRVFKDETSFSDTAYNVISAINRGVIGLVNVSFGDVGARFNPVGIPNENEDDIFYNQNNGLMETPQPTEIGTDFIVQLDNDLRIGSPVAIDSPTINAFYDIGKFVVRQIIHTGSNYAEGEFQSRVTSVFNRSALGADIIPGDAIA